MSSSSDSLRLTKTVTESKSLAGLREVYEPDIHVVTHCRAWAYPIARSGGLAEHAFLELTLREMGSGRCSTVRLDWTNTGLFGYVYLSSDAMRSDKELWHKASHIWNGIDQKMDDCMNRSVFVGTVLDACEIRTKLPYNLMSNNCQHVTQFVLRAVNAYADHHRYSIYHQNEDRNLMEQLIGLELRSKLKRGRQTGRCSDVFQIGNCTVLDCPAGYMSVSTENLLLWCVEHRRRFVVVCSCNVDAPRCSVRLRLKGAKIIDTRTAKTPVFHDAISFESMCEEIAHSMLTHIEVVLYGSPHDFHLSNEVYSFIKASNSSRDAFILWPSSRCLKTADLVVIQYEEGLTDDIRATMTECRDQKREVVLLRVLTDRRLLDQSLRQTVCGEMLAAGFGDVPHFFGVKNPRIGNFTDVDFDNGNFDDVDGIVQYISAISSGQATLHDILLSTWICKFFD